MRNKRCFLDQSPHVSYFSSPVAHIPPACALIKPHWKDDWAKLYAFSSFGNNWLLLALSFLSSPISVIPPKLRMALALIQFISALPFSWITINVHPRKDHPSAIKPSPLLPRPHPALFSTSRIVGRKIHLSCWPPHFFAVIRDGLFFVCHWDGLCFGGACWRGKVFV